MSPEDLLRVTELCVPDLAVGEEQLRDHLVVIGGADTNIFVAVATLAIQKAFGSGPSIHYAGDASGYFTCDEIQSSTSGTRYLRLEEDGGMHCGYVVFGRNPWNPTRTLTIVSGIRATGTQAALLALVLRTDELLRTGAASEPWRRLEANNRFNPQFAAKGG